MKKAAIVLCAIATLFGAPVAAEQEQGAQARLAKVSHDDVGLPPRAKQTRDQLYDDPAQIAAVVEAAAMADATAKAEIEFGVVRAAARFKCVDPAGYKALTDYLQRNTDNPVVADIQSALNAFAQAVGPSSAGAPGQTGGLSGGGGFSGGGGTPVSPH
jgi:uncharacterized membrane protein YgcG